MKLDSLKKVKDSAKPDSNKSGRLRVGSPSGPESEQKLAQSEHRSFAYRYRSVDEARDTKEISRVAKVERDAKGRVLPGASLNPWGRLPGVPQYIRHLTAEGRELIDHAVGVMRGLISVPDIHWTAEGFPCEYERLPNIKEQADSRNWLADRCWGKAPDKMELTVSRQDPVAARLDTLSPEEVDAFANIQIKLLASPRDVGDTQDGGERDATPESSGLREESSP